METVIVVIYLTVWVMLIWPIANHFAQDEPDPDVEDWFFGSVMGVCLGALWPLAFLPALSWYIWRRILTPREKEHVNDRSTD